MSRVQFEFMNHKAYKIIIFVACVIYVLWSPYNLAADPTSVDPLWERIAVSLPLFLITLYSYYNETLNRNIKYVFYAFVLIAVTQHHYLLYVNELKDRHTIGAIVLLFSISSVVESYRFKVLVMSYFMIVSLWLCYHFEGWNFYRPESKSALLLSCSLTVILMSTITQYLFSRVQGALQKEIAENSNLRKWSSLGQMAGGVAHEINSPLTTIYFSVDNLKEMIEDQKLSQEFVQELEKIKADAGRISSIMKALRLLTKEGTRFSRDAIHLHRICLEVIDQFREQAALEKIHVLFRTSLSERPIALGNSQSITQVVANLFKNAMEAIEHMSDKWIHVTLMEDSQNFIILVQDCGPGIPKEVQDRIFEPFYSTKEVGQGMGIGLSLSRQIAIAHGGDLLIDTSSSHTTFKLLIPKAESFEVRKAI